MRCPVFVLDKGRTRNTNSTTAPTGWDSTHAISGSSARVVPADTRCLDYGSPASTSIPIQRNGGTPLPLFGALPERDGVRSALCPGVARLISNPERSSSRLHRLEPDGEGMQERFIAGAGAGDLE